MKRLGGELQGRDVGVILEAMDIHGSGLTLQEFLAIVEARPPLLETVSLLCVILLPSVVLISVLVFPILLLRLVCGHCRCGCPRVCITILIVVCLSSVQDAWFSFLNAFLC